MGLLGLFFKGWFLKLILVIAATFLLLQALGGFVSFAAQLGTIQLIALAVIVLIAFAALSARSERFKFLSGLAKSLCFAVVPSLLLFEAVTSISPPSSLAVIPALTITFIPCIIFVVYRKRIWNWSNPASPQDIRRRYHKLTKSNLAPKGIETGHVVFSAGRRGFRTLKFIEIRSEQPQTVSRHAAFEETHCEAVKALSNVVTVAKKLRVEFSYELHWQDGTPHIMVAAICEGRGYRRCRSAVDEFTQILTQDPRLNHATTPSATQVDDSAKAEKVLMMPLFSSLANFSSIDSDDRNIILTSDSNPDRRTKLRIMRISYVPRIRESSVVSLLDVLLRVTRASNQVRNLVCTLHVKPLPDSHLKRETRKAEQAYHSAVARIIEEVNSKVHTDQSLATTLLIEHDKKTTDATSSANEAKNKLHRLRDAENSGYFGVSMTLIGEPATVENTARRLKTELSSFAPNPEVRIDRLPPIAFQAAIRRDPMIFFDKLDGHEVALLLAVSRNV